MLEQHIAPDWAENARKVWCTYHEGALTPPPEELNAPLLEDAVTQFSPLIPNNGHEPLVAVIGVGYVGTHLVTAFARHYNVIAYDISEARLSSVKDRLALFPRAHLTSNAYYLNQAAYFLVSVPTLVRDNGDVDTTHLRAALANVAMHAKEGSTIIIESSVAVGTTRSLLKDIISSRNLKAGMSPERVDPGRTAPAFEDIPKIVSGLDDIAPGSLSSIQALYSRVFSQVVPVSSPEVAEMTKLYENCQRMVAIAYVNEMADACTKLGIDPFEVSRSAATKPFGYLPVTPSAGVGGHCIPVNPHYLFSTSDFPLLRQATEKMRARPGQIVDRAVRRLLRDKKCRRRLASATRSLRALVVGMGFKRGQDILCCSPGVAMVQQLQQTWNAEVEWADPLVGEDAIPYARKFDEQQGWRTAILSRFDIIFVATRQINLDFKILGRLRHSKVEDWCP